MTRNAPGHVADAKLDVPVGRGLSAKLLMLTVAFVLLIEILVFLPAISGFRLRRVTERLQTAAGVSTLLLDVDPQNLTAGVQDDVLMSLGVKAIVVREAGAARLLALSKMPTEVDQQIDLENDNPFNSMPAALTTLFSRQDRVIRVFGPVDETMRSHEIVMSDRALRAAMWTNARNFIFLSLFISLLTAALVYLLLNHMMIAPVRTLTRSMLTFSDAPDDPARIIRPVPRSDEIGVAERELSGMQTRLQKLLAEQKHLADLGLAVSKINHDMRNILASAQLMSDRLRMVKDPAVKAFAPKLLRTLDRAVAYSEDVLAYGRAQEAPPSRRRVRLNLLVDEVHELLGAPGVEDIQFVNSVDADFEIDADSEQLFRILTNLCRNSVQAMTMDDDAAVVRRLTVAAERQGSVSRVIVSDTGPGLPKKALDNLFAAFRGSARSGGTGLGLAVSQELARAHGGSVELVESVGGRTIFAVIIPDQPIDIDAARRGLRREA